MQGRSSGNEVDPDIQGQNGPDDMVELGGIADFRG